LEDERGAGNDGARRQHAVVVHAIAVVVDSIAALLRRSPGGCAESVHAGVAAVVVNRTLSTGAAAPVVATLAVDAVGLADALPVQADERMLYSAGCAVRFRDVLTAGLGMATVDSAGIAVVAVRLSGPAAYSLRAGVSAGARVAVIAGVLVVDVRAAV